VERVLSRVSNGREYKFAYDAAGFVISEGNKQIFWDASHRQVTYTTIKQTYDEEGKITHWSNVYTDGSGRKSEFTYTYHDDGTVATRTETNVSMGPNGRNEHLFYDAVTTYEYNSQGLLIKEVKELSFALYREKGENTTTVNTIVYSYDENGRLIKEAEEQVSYGRYSGDVKVSSSNYTREYTYGWVYAPEAEGHPTIFWGSGIKTS
jgi:hypothetical protein